MGGWQPPCPGLCSPDMPRPIMAQEFLGKGSKDRMQPAYLPSPGGRVSVSSRLGGSGNMAKSILTTYQCSLSFQGQTGSEDLLGGGKGDKHGWGGGCKEGTPESWAQMPVPRSRGTESSTLTHHYTGHSSRGPGQSPSWERRGFQNVLRVLP